MGKERYTLGATVVDAFTTRLRKELRLDPTCFRATVEILTFEGLSPSNEDKLPANIDEVVR